MSNRIVGQRPPDWPLHPKAAVDAALAAAKEAHDAWERARDQDHHDEPRSPTAERDERTWTIHVCRVCGDYSSEQFECKGGADAAATFHRKSPAVPIEVRPADSPRPEERERIEDLEAAMRRTIQFTELPAAARNQLRAALLDYGSEDG